MLQRNPAVTPVGGGDHFFDGPELSGIELGIGSTAIY
jgi:hypothetical protein